MNLSGWTVLQAEARGVTGTTNTGASHDARPLASVAPDGWVRILRPPTTVNAARTLWFARGEVGADYGFLTVVSTGFDILTPSWFHLPVRRPGTWICSALASEALRYGGWCSRWPDIYQVTPAQAMAALLASGAVDVAPDGAAPGDVGFAHGTGFVSGAIRLGQRLAREPDWEVNHMFLLDRKVAP